MTAESLRLAAGVASTLAAQGTDQMFGVPGGGANLELIQAGADAGVRFVLMHGETAACMAASTYGLLSGGVGAAVVTRGPGLSSAINGLAQATLDRQPLVLLSDLVTAGVAGRVAHQRLDQRRLTAPVSQRSITVGTHATEAAIAAALDVAAGPPAGGVHVDLDPTVPGDAPGPRPVIADPDPAALDEARRLITGCARPVVIVGAGVRGAEPALQKMVADVGWPVLTTYQAKGSICEDDDNAAGVFTNGVLERGLLEQADVFILVGVENANELPGVAWAYERPVVALDSVAFDNPYFPIDIRVEGDLTIMLEELRSCPASAWQAGAGQRHRSDAVSRIMASADAASGLSPQAAVVAMQDAAPPDAVLTVDSGVHLLVAMALWTARSPHSALISRGLATMGYAVPAALGAALARPQSRVLCLTGDGGLGMTLAELETLRRTGANVTVVVFNDNQLTMIALKQPDGGGGGPGAVRYGAIDFAAVAEGMGVPARSVDNEDDLRAALRRDVAGPQVIDVRIDVTPYADVMRATRG